MAPSRIIQASDLKRYDMLVFDSRVKTIELWRIERGRKRMLAAKSCREIPSQEYFLGIVQTFGSRAQLTCTIEDKSFPQGVWAYQYI